MFLGLMAKKAGLISIWFAETVFRISEIKDFKVRFFRIFQ